MGRRIVENEDYSRNRLVNQIELDHTVQEAVAGQDHSLLVTDTGRVLGAGWGADGQGYIYFRKYPPPLLNDIRGGVSE